MLYEKPLSDSVKKVMYKVMKHASAIQNGFLFFRNRLVLKAHVDRNECSALLKQMIINEENVLRYLRRKYIPTWMTGPKKGAIFKDQACIQNVTIKEDGTLQIRIAKSEPHKIITDTFHVINLLSEQGYEFSNDIKFIIDQVQIAYQDTLLYNVLLREFGMKPPASATIYEKKLLAKYGKLEEVAKIKKKSVKRKFLRYFAKIDQIEWVDLRKVIAIEDFSANNIKRVCNEIRQRNKERGIVVKY